MKLSNYLRVAGAATVMVATSLALAGCTGGSGDDGGGGGGGTTPVTSGSLASTVDLSSVKISVGSKEAPSQLILGQILVQTLRAAGAEVADNTNLNGTKVVRAALLSGQIDTYYEYTGTAWLTLFNKTEVVNNSEKLLDMVTAIDADNGITWFAPLLSNDSYGLGASKAAKQFGITTISEYADFVRTNPDDATLCAGSEFRTRDDGLPGLEETYNFTQPDSSIFEVEDPVKFEAVKQGECNFLYLTTSDPRNYANEVTIFKDDKEFFPIYNPVLNMKTEVYTANEAAYDALFIPISAMLTDEVILELSAGVTLDGLPASAVAEKFLKEKETI